MQTVVREVVVIGVASLDAGASSRDGTRGLLGAIRERGDSLLVGSGLLHSRLPPGQLLVHLPVPVVMDNMRGGGSNCERELLMENM